VDESVRRLEEKIAYLERHVVEQDKAMLGFSEELAALRREIRGLREPDRTRGGQDGQAGEPPAERPPHY
jgi:SlyX protein